MARVVGDERQSVGDCDAGHPDVVISTVLAISLQLAGGARCAPRHGLGDFEHTVNRRVCSLAVSNVSHPSVTTAQQMRQVFFSFAFK